MTKLNTLTLAARTANAIDQSVAIAFSVDIYSAALTARACASMFVVCQFVSRLPLLTLLTALCKRPTELFLTPGDISVSGDWPSLHSVYYILHCFCLRRPSSRLCKLFLRCHVAFVDVLSFFALPIFSVLSRKVTDSRHSMCHIHLRLPL